MQFLQGFQYLKSALVEKKMLLTHDKKEVCGAI